MATQAKSTLLRKRKHEMEEDFHNLKRFTKSLLRIFDNQDIDTLLVSSPPAMRKNLQAILDTGRNIRCLQTTGMKIVTELKRLSEDTAANFQDFINQISQPQHVLEAADLQVRSVDGYGMGHAVIEYVHEMEDVCKILKAIVKNEVVDDTQAEQNAAVSEPEKRELLAQMFMCTEQKPADLNVLGAKCFCMFSSLAINKDYSMENCLHVLNIVGDYIVHGKNVHNHTVLGVAAAACAHGNCALMEAILKKHAEPSKQGAFESLWSYYSQDAKSGLFTHVDANGLTPFAYIVMFGKPAWLEHISPAVLKNVVMQGEIIELTDTLSLYGDFPPLFPALMHKLGSGNEMQINLTSSQMSYLHLAALAPVEHLPVGITMVDAILQRCNLSRAEFLRVCQCCFVRNGDLSGFCVSSLQVMIQKLRQGNDLFLKILLNDKGKEQQEPGELNLTD